MLENMIMELANPRSKRKKQELELEPVETFDFDQYLIKFEKIIQDYEDMIYDIVAETVYFSSRHWLIRWSQLKWQDAL